jgi:hypothetical protein
VLKAREAKLLASHRAEWLGGDTPPVRTVDFVRGTVRVGNAAEYLDRTDFYDWLRSPVLPWVEQVDLNYSSADWFVKTELPDALYGRVGLNLDVSGNNPRSIRPQFQYLVLSGNFGFVRAIKVTAADGGVVLDEITKGDVSALVALSVSGDNAQQALRLVASAPFTSLSTLDVGDITEPGLRALIASPHLGNLTHLNLAGSPIGDGGLIALCRSKMAQTLRGTEVPKHDYVRGTDAGLGKIGISDVGAIAFARSPLMANLNGPRLNLMMNQIGDAGLTALAESEHLLRFRELVLRENVVGDDGVEALAASPYAANLQYLDFWRNRITDRGAFALTRSPHLNKVVDLSVKENAVTAAGAAAPHERFGERAKV